MYSFEASSARHWTAMLCGMNKAMPSIHDDAIGQGAISCCTTMHWRTGYSGESEYRGTLSTTASGRLLLAPKTRIKEMTLGIRDLISLVAEDYRVHGSDWTRPGFRALAVYRF